MPEVVQTSLLIDFNTLGLTVCSSPHIHPKEIGETFKGLHSHQQGRSCNQALQSSRSPFSMLQDPTCCSHHNRALPHQTPYLEI